MPAPWCKETFETEYRKGFRPASTLASKGDVGEILPLMKVSKQLSYRTSTKVRVHRTGARYRKGYGCRDLGGGVHRITAGTYDREVSPRPGFQIDMQRIRHNFLLTKPGK
jgi:hypothetical protein